MPPAKHVSTPVLDIAYEDSGPATGPVSILLHGFPYDPRSYDGVVPVLNAAGQRTIVPYLRGYGPTRFRAAATMRSGEQAAIGQDLLELMDALDIETATLAGYDWGGRAANVVAAIWPERVNGLVTCCGYQIQDIASAGNPVEPDGEWRHWYQHYFQLERGRLGLTQNRDALCKLLWQLWSPTWKFDDATFAATAHSFGNSDFVDVVIHSYRHRMGNAAGDPAYAALEAKLARQPKIAVPTISVHGLADEVNLAKKSEGHARYFTGRYERRAFPNVGHCPPGEAPSEFAEAVLAVARKVG